MSAITVRNTSSVIGIYVTGLTSTTPILSGSPFTAQVSSEKNYDVLRQSNIGGPSAPGHTDCFVVLGVLPAFRRLAAGPPSGMVAIVAG